MLEQLNGVLLDPLWADPPNHRISHFNISVNTSLKKTRTIGFKGTAPDLLLVEQNVEMGLSISRWGYVINQGVIQFESV